MYIYNVYKIVFFTAAAYIVIEYVNYYIYQFLPTVYSVMWFQSSIYTSMYTIYDGYYTKKYMVHIAPMN